MSRSPTAHRNDDGPASGVGRPLDDVFGALASRRRREILAVLRGHDGELSESDLATVLSAERADKPLLDVTDAEHQRIRTRLRHVHLPKLADAGLIRRDEARETVSAGRLGAVAPILDGVRESGADADADPEAVDAVLSALAVERRRTVLSILREEGALDPAELAERVAEREAGRRETGTREAEEAGTREAEEAGTREAERTEMREAETGTHEVADDEIEAVRAALRHSHLPKLKQVGLVKVGDDGNDENDETEADDGNGAISFDGHPALDPRWLRLADEPKAEVSARVRACDCGTLEECEDLYVVSSADDLDAGTVVRLRSHTEQGGEESQ